MTVTRGASLALVAGLLLSGCSEKPTVGRGSERAEPAHATVLRIVFDLPGDDIGSPEYRKILDALKDSITDRKAGEVLRSGYGMGTMEIVVEVDRDDSQGVLRALIGDVYPEAKYRIERTTE